MIDIFCIGSPRVNGDAVGPMIGTMLANYTFDEDIQIIGNMDEPVILDSFEKQHGKLRPTAFVIAIDAALGDSEDIGTWSITEEPIQPGAALLRDLHPVGNVAIRIYTGACLIDLHNAPKWEITRLAYTITTRLVDLLTTNEIKGIYREYNTI